MAEPVLRETESLDMFERAVLFALQRALRRDREEAGRRRMTIVEGGKQGGGPAT